MGEPEPTAPASGIGQVGRIVPAATVVPLREGGAGLEVLLLRRSSRGAFGGMWVFPGGQVDPGDMDTRDMDAGDRDAGPAPASGAEAEIRAARRAAVREAKEEADLELEESSLVTHSFWLPPPEAPRRFATWFFLAPAGGEIVVDHGEIREHRWLAPSEAMESRDRGEIDLAPPTFVTLWWLSRRKTVAEALADAGAREPDRFETRVAVDAGGRLAATLWDGDAGYADGDLDKPGSRRRMWMSPGGWRVEINGT